MLRKKETQVPVKAYDGPVYWVETTNTVSRQFQFENDGCLSVSCCPIIGQFFLQFYELGVPIFNLTQNFIWSF